MNANRTYYQRRLAAVVAAGGCFQCRQPREAITPGGATKTRCATCANKMRAANVRRRHARAERGECGDCGAVVPGSNGKTLVRCAACKARQSAYGKVRYAKRIKARRCIRCKKQLRWNVTEPGGTQRMCADCAKIVVHQWRARVYRKRMAAWNGEAPRPRELPPSRRIQTRPMGRLCRVGVRIGKDTMEAIQTLKARYREAQPDASFRCSVSELLRNAITSVLRKGGPLRVDRRERMCVPGWSFSMVVPLAMYEQITQIANAQFEGSRAWAIRVAIRQAVKPPLICRSGGRKGYVPNPPRPRSDWDDD